MNSWTSILQLGLRCLRLNAQHGVRACSNIQQMRSVSTVPIKNTFENLHESDFKLVSEVTDIKINDVYGGRGVDGGSLFMYECVPQIKYHNPSVNVVCTKNVDEPFSMSVTTTNEETNGDKETVSIQMENRTYGDIKREFRKLFQAS